MTSCLEQPCSQSHGGSVYTASPIRQLSTAHFEPYALPVPRALPSVCCVSTAHASHVRRTRCQYCALHRMCVGRYLRSPSGSRRCLVTPDALSVPHSAEYYRFCQYWTAPVACVGRYMLYQYRAAPIRDVGKCCYTLCQSPIHREIKGTHARLWYKVYGDCGCVCLIWQRGSSANLGHRCP